MSIDDDIAMFEQIPMLAPLGHETLRILAIGAENRSVHEGSALFREGEAADAGYVIQEGSFDLTSQSKENFKPMTVGRGCLLGELALITETARAVTATAREPSTVVRIPRTLFLKMLEGYPDVAHRLRDAMMARINQATADIYSVRNALDGGEGRS
jgi:CRP-like cAMP-binding protein